MRALRSSRDIVQGNGCGERLPQKRPGFVGLNAGRRERGRRFSTEENRRIQRKTTAQSQERGCATPIGRLALPGDDGRRRKRAWGARHLALKAED